MHNLGVVSVQQTSIEQIATKIIKVKVKIKVAHFIANRSCNTTITGSCCIR